MWMETRRALSIVVVTIDTITTIWKEQADDTAALEQRQRALALISAHETNENFEQAYGELKLIAQAALE